MAQIEREGLGIQGYIPKGRCINMTSDCVINHWLDLQLGIIFMLIPFPAYIIVNGLSQEYYPEKKELQLDS